MGIKDGLERKQREQNEQQQILELLSDLHDRLDGIERNQREVVSATNASTQSIIRIWNELEELRQQKRPQSSSGAFANVSREKTLTILGETQKEILEVLRGSKIVKLPDGSTLTASDASAHNLMQSLTKQMKGLMEADSKLADEVRRKGAVNIDYEKLATYIVPRLDVQIRAHEKAAQEALVDASAPMLADLERSRSALWDAGIQVTAQIRRAGEQVEGLRALVTWRMAGQIGAALLPLALVTFVVFGMAQTVWAAFGLQPILHTLWGWFSEASEWYWKIAIAGSAFVVLAGFGWFTLRLGETLHRSYRGY